jgi:peptide/nickel transport system permease protein
MWQYVAKRLLLFIPTIILVTLIVFVIMRLIPGDPALLILSGDSGEGQFTMEELDSLRHELGTDRPIHVQYFSWMGDLLQGDFGTSLFYDTPVSDDLTARIPVTLQLAFMAILIAVLISVPLGVLSAVKQDTPIDYVARLFTIAGVAMPTFVAGILVVFLLVIVFGWLPPLGYAVLWEDPLKNLQQMIFPALALGFYDTSFIARVTRSSMLEVFREDYVRTARSKGLAEFVVIARHALKNAFLPVITVSGWQLGRLIAGTVIIETIFLVPGVGRLLVDSIFHRDFTMLQAVIILAATLVLLLNLFIDLVYAYLDPRIRYA